MENSLQVGYLSGNLVLLVNRGVELDLVRLSKRLELLIVLLHGSILSFQSCVFLGKLVHEFLSHEKCCERDESNDLPECLKRA